MRIAYVCQSYPPMISGAALVVQRLAEGIAARGHSVTVMAASDVGRPYVQQVGGLRVLRLRALPNPWRVGQHFVAWPRHEIAGELAAFQPDLVHLHDPAFAGLAALRVCRAMEVAAALTLHQLPWFVSAYLPPVPGLRKGIENTAWAYISSLGRKCAAIITPSKMIAEVVRMKSGLRPVAITNGVDLSRFSPHSPSPDEAAGLRRKYQLDPDLPVILYVGRIDADKQVDQVVRAVAEATRKVRAQLLVVGDGKQREAITRLSAALGIGALSHFPGFVAASGDLPGLYRLASVFVTASEVEIQSSVVLEAAASGLPVVAVRASSMAEFVQDGVTGYLAEPGDCAALADRLVALVKDPEGARAMGRAGLALASQHTVESAIAGHEALYQTLVASDPILGRAAV